MFAFIAIFSAFNLFAAAAGAGAGMRLLTADAKAAWASKNLYRIALAMCWGIALSGVLGTILAWTMWRSDAHWALFVLVPIAWLIAMGIVFAIVDFAEDGVFDFGRGPKPKI